MCFLFFYFVCLFVFVFCLFWLLLLLFFLFVCLFVCGCFIIISIHEVDHVFYLKLAMSHGVYIHIMYFVMHIILNNYKSTFHKRNLHNLPNVPLEALVAFATH